MSTATAAVVLVVELCSVAGEPIVQCFTKCPQLLRHFRLPVEILLSREKETPSSARDSPLIANYSLCPRGLI